MTASQLARYLYSIGFHALDKTAALRSPPNASIPNLDLQARSALYEPRSLALRVDSRYQLCDRRTRFQVTHEHQICYEGASGEESKYLGPAVLAFPGFWPDEAGS